jgi:hypothetical protein
MENYGLKVSNPGKDVGSETPEDLIFNSVYSTVKVVQEPADGVYYTVTIDASSSVVITITHNLGFAPLVLLFTELKPNSGHWYCGGLAWPSPSDCSDNVYLDGEVDSGTYVDETYLKIRYTNGTGSQKTVKYYYYIFGDSGE